MAGYISSNRAKINQILPKLRKVLKVDSVFTEPSSKSFSLTLTYNGFVDGIDSVLLFEINVELEEDKAMSDFVSFYKNHSLTGRISIKSKKGTHQHSNWHFDTENKKFNLMHPKYHFQYGGMAAKNLGIICYNTPRLFSFPIDYVCAIDFFICNFFEEKLAKQFREESSYVTALRFSQNVVLKGYHDLLYRYSTRNISSDETDIVRKLIPSIAL
jgi:hypothetical protein